MNLLLIAYHFPPDGAIGAVRPYQFARLLPQYGIQTWVLTVRPEHARQLNPDFQPTGIEEERIIRTAVFPSRRDSIQRFAQTIKALAKSGRMHPAGGSNAITQVGAEVRRRPLLLSCFLEMLEYPDRYAGWFQPAWQAVQELTRRVQFSAVYSTSPPRTCALIARHVAEQYRLPWLMDMRDPWITLVEGWRTTIQCPLVRTWHQKALSRCLQRANVVLANTPVLAEYFAGEYPQVAEKVRVLPNGIADTALSAPTAHLRSDKLTIGHFGTVYGCRTTYDFLQGVSLWLQANPQHRARLQLLFYGESAEDIAGFAKRFGMSEIVQVHPPVPRTEVPAMMERCGALLLLAQQQPMQVPGKVYEYLATGKPIIAMTESNSATGRLLQGIPQCYIAPNAEQVSQTMEQLWHQYSSGELFCDRTSYLAPFRYSHLAEQLAKWVKEVVDHSQETSR